VPHFSSVTTFATYNLEDEEAQVLDWIEQSQHSIGYMGDGFYRSKDPTNSIKDSKY